MNPNNSTIVNSRNLRLSAYATLAGAALATPALTPSADATVVTSGPVNIVVAPTFAGIYINFVTGAFSATASAVPGYDFDPYGSSANLSFFFPTSAGGVTSGGVFSNLAPGSIVDSAATFTGSASSSATALANYRVTGQEYLGVEFLNESTGVINYGYVHFSTTATTGFPATVLDYAYENSGGAITVVPEPATVASFGLGALALGAVAVRRWRRNRGAV